MTRADKKCLVFSVGMHVLLGVILIGGAAFQPSRKSSDFEVITMIPSKIVDEPGVGGGSPDASPPPAQPVAQPAAQPPAQPAPQPQPQEVTPPKPKPVEVVKMVESKPKPVEPERVVERKPEPKPEVVETSPHGDLPTPKPTKKKPHEVQVDYTPYDASSAKKIKERAARDEADAQAAAEASAAKAKARQGRAIREALNSMASGLTERTAAKTVVDLQGSGGEAFADYKTVIFNVYRSAWRRVKPDVVANKLASAMAKIVVGRDGAIISAEMISPSGDAGMDKSVERALRAVKSLPPFPAEAHDQQRSFSIQFDLTSEEGSG